MASPPAWPHAPANGESDRQAVASRWDQTQSVAARGAQPVTALAARVDRNNMTSVGRKALTSVAGRAGTAARSSGTVLRHVGWGIAAFWRGLGLFLRSPVLWLWALLPAVAVHFITIGGEVGIKLSSRPFARWAAGFADDWPRVLHVLIEVTIRWSVVVMAHAVLVVVTVPLTLLIGAPCYLAIMRRVERRLNGAVQHLPGQPPPPPWGAAVLFTLRQTILVSLIVFAGAVIALPILLIPGLNVVAGFFVVLVLDGFLIGLLALGMPLHHRGIAGWRAHMRFAWDRRAAVIGFGAMSMLVLTVPFAPLRLISVSVVFVGGVLLHRRFAAATTPASWPVPAAGPPVPGTGAAVPYQHGQPPAPPWPAG